MKCKCCGSGDIVLATVKKTGRRIAVCEECDYIYDLDSEKRPIIDNQNKDNVYLKELHTSFKTWDELTDIVRYKEEET